MEEGKIVKLTTCFKNKKNKVNQKGKMSAKPVIKKEFKCFYYKEKKGHMKQDFPRFKNQLEKIGNYFAWFVMDLI